MKYILLLFSLFFCNLHAQNFSTEKIDSMFYINITDYTLEENLNHFKNVYEISEKANYEKGQIYSLLYLSELYQSSAQYQKAIEKFDEINSFPSKEDTYNFKIKALQNKSNAYMRLGFYDDAIRVLDETDVLTKNVKSNIVFFFNGISMNQRAQLSSLKDNPIDSTLKYLHLSANQFKQIEHQLPREAKLVDCYVQMGELFLKKNQLDSVLFYTRKVLPLKNVDGQSQMKVYKFMGSAFQDNNNDSAIYYFNKSLEIAKKIGHKESQKEINKSLASIFEKENKNEDFLKHSNEYYKINDSIVKLERLSINEVSNSIKNELFVKSNQEKKKLYLAIGITLLTLCILAFFAFKFFKNYRKVKINKEIIDQEITQKETELTNLSSIKNTQAIRCKKE